MIASLFYDGHVLCSCGGAVLFLVGFGGLLFDFFLIAVKCWAGVTVRLWFVGGSLEATEGVGVGWGWDWHERQSVRLLWDCKTGGGHG